MCHNVSHLPSTKTPVLQAYIYIPYIRILWVIAFKLHPLGVAKGILFTRKLVVEIQTPATFLCKKT